MAKEYTEPSTSSSIVSLPQSTPQEINVDIAGTSSTGQVTLPTAEVESPLAPCRAVPTIVLTQFRRAAETQAYCFFPGCHYTERLIVPLSIRVRLFADFNYYIPAHCRICHYHLRGNYWHKLNEIEGNHTFTEAHIYDFTSLLKKDKLIDFENIDTIDDYLVHFWFGISKEQFNTILSQVPRLHQMHR